MPATASPDDNAQSGGRAGRRAREEGVFTGMLVADPDPDIDERPMHEIALARLEAMKQV